MATVGTIERIHDTQVNNVERIAEFDPLLEKQHDLFERTEALQEAMELTGAKVVVLTKTQLGDGVTAEVENCFKGTRSSQKDPSQKVLVFDSSDNTEGSSWYTLSPKAEIKSSAVGSLRRSERKKNRDLRNINKSMDIYDGYLIAVEAAARDSVLNPGLASALAMRDDNPSEFAATLGAVRLKQEEKEIRVKYQSMDAAPVAVRALEAFMPEIDEVSEETLRKYMRGSAFLLTHLVSGEWSDMDEEQIKSLRELVAAIQDNAERQGIDLT